jgi:hypothetical protein
MKTQKKQRQQASASITPSSSLPHDGSQTASQPDNEPIHQMKRGKRQIKKKRKKRKEKKEKKRKGEENLSFTKLTWVRPKFSIN